MPACLPACMWGVGGGELSGSALCGGLEAQIVLHEAAGCAADGAEQQDGLTVEVAAPDEGAEDAAVAHLLRGALRW